MIPVYKNVPVEEAVEKLLEIIKKDLTEPF